MFKRIESKLTVKYKANKAESINNIRTDLAKYFQVIIIKYSYKPIFVLNSVRICSAFDDTDFKFF